MKRFANLVCLWQCTAVALALDVAETSGVPNGFGEAFARARAELHHAVQDGRVAGAAHLVVQNGQTLHSEAVGFNDLQTKTPFTVDSILRVYSMSKPITSVGAMMLFEQGQYALDDPVARFIPAFTNATVLVSGDGSGSRHVRPRRPITVRDVLRHTTGYSYGDEASVREFYVREGLRYWGPEELFPPKMSIAQAAEALARVPALHHPGEKFTYGFSTDLLGRLIEVWSGESLDRYLRRAVFEPLEMVDTGFSVPKEKRSRFASCHILRDGQLAVLDPAASSPFNEGFEFLSGGGGLVSTVRDYANFCQMLVDGGQFKDRRLLQPGTLRLMFTDQLDGVDGTHRFGLGFGLEEVTLGRGTHQRKATCYRWGGYASTQFAVVPDERLFQIFALQQLPYTEELAKQLFGIIHAALPPRAGPSMRASDAVGASPGAGASPGYQTDTNILYRTVGDRTAYERERCRLDVYYPTDRKGFATVVWFHGGGLTGGNRSIPGSLKDRGIAVVAAGYRLSPRVKSPAYIEDAAAAVAWTFRNIERYGGATNRIFVSGHSAGGYLTSMVGLDRRWLAAHGLDANRLAGLVPLSPQAITHFTIRAERGLSDRQPIVDDLAPLFHVRKDAPPILLVTGDREKELLGRYEENAYFWRMFRVVGHPDAELVELEGYDHGQMAEPAYPLLLRFIGKHSPASPDSPVVSSHWNQFRGPNGQGVAPAAQVPLHFGPETNVLWKLAVPPGHSSPVIWDNQLYLTAVEADNPQGLLTLGIDRRVGRILWRQQVRSEPPGAFHPLNNAASSTPVVDAQRVYAYFGTHGLVAYDHAGNQVWERRLDPPKSKYGMATSPILYRDTVILVQDGDEGRSRLLALRKDTGETAWEQPRPLFKAGWSTPMIFRHGAVEDLVVLGSRRLTAYDPATGQERWWAGGFPEETVGVPVGGDGLLYASGAALGGRGDDHWDAAATWRTTVVEFDRNRDGQIQREEMTPGFAFIQRPELPRDNPGYGLPVRDMDVLLRIFDHDRNGILSEAEWMQTMAGFAAISHPTLVALRPGASGDARPTHVAWELRRGIPETASLLCAAGRLYLMRDGGLLTCLEAATGRELFRERIGAPGQYIASPIAVGEQLVVASTQGVVTVIQTADTLRVLARNELGEGIYATPATAGGHLYVRTVGYLHAFGW